MQHPESIVGINGEIVVWQCKAKRSDEIQFLVNNTFASEKSVNDKGFVQTVLEDVNNTTQRINLTATALTQYNNTEIQCAAFIISGNATVLLSNIGNLLVQGKSLYINLFSYTNVI